MLEAQIATGEELPFEKLYEKSRKEKKNTELQQKLLIRAPHFIGTQNGYNQEKWKVRIDALFPEYLKTKKLENMINPTDFTILSLYHPEMEKQDGIFDFVVKNYDRYGEAVDKEITLSDFTTRISCGFAVPARPTTGRPSDASAVTSGPFMPACRSAT